MPQPNNRAGQVDEETARAVLIAAISIFETAGLAPDVMDVLTALRNDVRMNLVSAARLVREIALTATYERGYEKGLMGHRIMFDVAPEYARGYQDARNVKTLNLLPPSSFARVRRAVATPIEGDRCLDHPEERLQLVGRGVWECPECARIYDRKDLH